MNETKPVSEYDRFIVRLPDGMKERIANRAAQNNRSMNSEVIILLETAMGSEEEEQIKLLETELRIVEALKQDSENRWQLHYKKIKHLRQELDSLLNLTPEGYQIPYRAPYKEKAENES